MASAFAHALLASTLGKSYPKLFRSPKFFLLGAACSILPDADVMMFKLGIPYEHFLGHRGFSHSLAFSLLLGFLITKLFYSSTSLTSTRGLQLALFLTLCTASHILLDALTNGGLGVAVFSPFDNTRYFLPWRPIQVSPIGAGRFFSEKGLAVVKSELVWVGLPCLVYMRLLRFFRKPEVRSVSKP